MMSVMHSFHFSFWMSFYQWLSQHNTDWYRSTALPFRTRPRLQVKAMFVSIVVFDLNATNLKLAIICIRIYLAIKAYLLSNANLEFAVGKYRLIYLRIGMAIDTLWAGYYSICPCTLWAPSVYGHTHYSYFNNKK